MNEEFWKEFPPIPDIGCVAMKHTAQSRISEETRGMSPDEIVAYFTERAQLRASKAGSPFAAAPMLREGPADYPAE